MDNDTKRNQAVIALQHLRDYLESQQQAYPDAEALLPAGLSEQFNEAVFKLKDEFGIDWVRSVSYKPQDVIPKSKHKGGNPIVDAIGRDGLLSRVRSVLEKIEHKAEA